ncbi:Importin subunit alpha-1 [Pelomyxa schiedti]|nr:Importin subunit alpha-1 [Pelomyxa schiedti]
MDEKDIQQTRQRPGDYGRGAVLTAVETTTTTTRASSSCPEAASSSVAEAASAANSNDRDVALTGMVKAAVLRDGSSKQTEEVLKCGIVPQFIALISSSPDVDVCQQATWALSNILGDCAAHRDYVLKLGFFPVLLKAMVRFPNKVLFLRNATEAISNGCQGVPPPDISYFQPSNDARESVSPLPALQCTDADVLTHTCWALSYMAASPPCIKLLISTGTIIPSLTRLLSVSDTNIQVPALRALGTVANGRFTLSFQFTLMINESNVTLHPVLKKLRA